VLLSSEDNRSIFDTPNYHLNGFSHPNILVIPQQRSEVLAPSIFGMVPTDKTSSQIEGLLHRSGKIW